MLAVCSFLGALTPEAPINSVGVLFRGVLLVVVLGLDGRTRNFPSSSNNVSHVQDRAVHGVNYEYPGTL